MPSSFRVIHFLTATSFIFSLLACSSNDAMPDGGSNGGTPGPTATGGSAGKGGAQGLGGATQKGSGGGPGGGGATGTGGKATGGTTGGGTGEYGFTYRSPGSHTESCTSEVLRGQTLTINAPDQDWLCTFNVAGQKGYVYARTTANGAACIYSNAFPTYKVELAQISIGGLVTDLANPQYDGGGNHHNDALRFDYQGSTYEYYHSSFGTGGRRCQDMDCINIYAVGGTTPTTEGCASTRTLPEVCVLITDDGTHGPLVDKFTKCPGDPNK